MWKMMILSLCGENLIFFLIPLPTYIYPHYMILLLLAYLTFRHLYASLVRLHLAEHLSIAAAFYGNWYFLRKLDFFDFLSK